ncbi:Protein of unknown function DUF566 [Macleaya cordata]|uniref:QWRF family n=1 Tax=Macleaya cordata TaxID=56857 RepID=A0A200QIU0_MACCD|nr:Protein of unknown function DUF566 [Macleaya cordata]
MDVCEAEQVPRKGAITEEIPRPPLVPSEKNNAVSRRTRITREVPSRYKSSITSPSLSTNAVSRRSSSPNVTRTISSSSPLFSKRSISAERRRPSTPPSPPRPSTPNRDSLADIQSPATARKLVGGGRTTEGLWPSTMRSLCVSFQSDTFSLPVSKKEKPVTHDHTLKPSANLAHRQTETPLSQRKTTPERKRTPLRGRNASDQSENSRPLDNSHARTVDQRRWPSRTGGKLSGSALTRSMDLTDKPSRTGSSPLRGRGLSPSKKSPGRGLQKSQSEVASRLLFDEIGRGEYETCTGDDVSLRSFGPHKLGSSISSNSSERSSSTYRTGRSQSLPIPGSVRPPSPSKAPLLSSSPSRGMLSPSRTRPTTPFPSVNSVTSRSSCSSSVLSFIADVKKGRKGANHIEDAHQLRLLYNRYIQWRYINARADAALSIQQITAERTLYNVWFTTSELWDSVTMKRINLRELRQELKLNSVLNEQMIYLDDWALLEREHSSSLAGAIEALEACTLRLPVTGGARADSHTLKDAVCSALDVMQAMGSSVCSLLSRVEGMNGLVSELADVTAQERAVLDECGDLLASTAAMQVEENSLRTHLIQLKQALTDGVLRTSTIETSV